MLNKTVGNVDVSAIFTTKNKSEGDVNEYRVGFTNKDTNEFFAFLFLDNLVNTEKYDLYHDGLMKNILWWTRCEYFADDEAAPKDFIQNLHRVIDEETIELFPED